MAENVEGKYCFLVEWFDNHAKMVKQYTLYYYRVDDTIEMFDNKNKRTFLKRCSYPTVQLNHLFVGAQINVYARQLKILAYGDEWTKNNLSTKQARHLLVVKPNAYQHIGSIIQHVTSNGCSLAKLQMLRLSQSEAAGIFGDRSNEFTTGPVVAMEVVGADVQSNMDSMSGASDMVYVSTPDTGSTQCKQLLENPNTQTTAQFDNCSVCLIRPHAAAASGRIVDSILRAGFEISAMQIFNLDRTAADEFLEVYKTVIPEYNAIADGLTTGPSLVLEIRGQDVVNRFRDFCGPVDPEVARLIRPDCIRAEFGVDKPKNAVHCTDLPEDGRLESEYFFSILRKSDAITFHRDPMVSSYTSFNNK